MWITPAAMCHLFRDQMYLQTGDTCLWWLPHFFLIICHSCRSFQTSIYSLQNFLDISLILPPLDFHRNFATTTMETAEHWLMAWEYSIWNATIASLQFWTEDLDPVTLSIATEWVYTTFFWTSTSHTLHQQSEETLFGCFVIALNAAYSQQLSLADEGYKSSSDTVDLPTPLQKTPHIHHVSSIEHASFNPVWHYTSQYSYHDISQFTTKLLPDQCATTYPSAQILTIPQTALQHVQTAQMKRKKIYR